MTATASCSYVTGYSGGTQVRFEATVSRRHVGVIVERDAILKLAAAFKFNPNQAGHAAWHLNNPDSAMPCSSCEVQS